jgi:PAS domain-containing protein
MNDSALEKKIMSLRKTLSWMDLVMANVNECILVLDKDWRVVFINSYMAELLGQDRVLLLGKYFWEVVPFKKILPNNHPSLKIESISKFNGVYNLNTKSMRLKMLMHCKFVENLQQAICIMSDVSIELKASGELMKLHRKIAALEAKLAKQSK